MRLCSGEPDGFKLKMLGSGFARLVSGGKAAFVLGGGLWAKRTWWCRAWRFRARVVARMGLLHVGDGEICLVRTRAPCSRKKDA